ncbi:MAG: cytochrome bc complex cytochrome b subunit [Deltaproteobacteria bacterium]|nr:cytochrome bc complex cytochrome b subunit [Deltaproteobacteria bacterium]
MSTSSSSTHKQSRLFHWLNERVDLTGAMDFARSRRVPHHRWALLYHLGGATLFVLFMLVSSGILLSLHYRPSMSDAHSSVEHIITNVPFGDLVRSVHVWSAELMIGLLIAHVFAVWLTRAYRKPRELTWVLGSLLLLAATFSGFTGYLLPWSEFSYNATRVGTEIAANVPIVGSWLRQFLRGGEDVGGQTLARFFGLHIALLPGCIAVLLFLHIVQVQRLGVSTPSELTRRGKVKDLPYFPNIMLRDFAFWLSLLALVLSLAAFAPRDLGPEADPFRAAPANIKPEWYFLFVYQTLKLLPADILGVEGDVVGVTGFCIAFLYVVALPFLDRGERGSTRAGWLALCFFLGMTVYGWLD